jgi:Fe-S cluster assembly ATP-binding protein
MLTIKNLHAHAQGHKILQGLNLSIKPGEVHAIMGPNGAGKSTLANVLAGHEGYDFEGSVEFLGQDLLVMKPEERAVAGLFLAFQYPVEIPGVNNMYFLKTALNSLRKARGENLMDAMDFMKLIKEKVKQVEMVDRFLNRSVNEGFSGGEKKRNEVLQMLMLEPKLAILDETDSGLDIDALQSIAKGVNQLRDKDRSFIVVTHYQRLLNYIEPDFVHVMMNGKIVESGGKELSEKLEKNGYGWLQA